MTHRSLLYPTTITTTTTLGTLLFLGAFLTPLTSVAQTLKSSSFMMLQVSPKNDTADKGYGKKNENSNDTEEGRELDSEGLEATTSTTSPTTSTDPLSFINRPIFFFNDTADKFILKPVAKTYDNLTPRIVKLGVNNFFQNLKEPGNIVNYTLQGNKEAVGNSASRLLTNTFIGVGGIFDVASEAKLYRRNTNFGSTLSLWGVAPGPYVVLPLMGPSNVRDASAALLVDIHTKPQNYLSGSEQTATLATELVATRAQYLKATDMMDNAIIGERYDFIKNAAEQKVKSDDERLRDKESQ